jgi:GcrA cell cycle regulator
MKTANVDWSEGNVETLKAMWKDGESVADIAKAITGSPRNRNAILGKAHRLDLGAHPNGRKPTRKTKLRRKADEEAKRQEFNAKQRERYAAKKAVKQRTEDIPMVAATRTLNPRPQNVSVARDGMTQAVTDSRALASSVWRIPPGYEVLPIEKLNDHTCRFPLGDPRDGQFGYCGKPTAERPPRRKGEHGGRHPYCAHHQSICTAKEVNNG